MLEALVLVITALSARILLAPLLRRLRPPAWLERARIRGRPGVPVTAILAALLLMLLLWLIGERRGLPGAVLFLFWIAAPLTAFELLIRWRRPRREQRQQHSGS